MRSKKIYLRSLEVMLGITKIDDIVDYDVRGIIRGIMTEMEEEMKETAQIIKSAPYEMKLAFMKFYENGTNLAEAEYGPDFTAKNLQDSMIKIMNGNPLNMMSMMKTNDVIKN